MALSKIPSAGFQDNVKFRNIIINGDMSIAQRGTSQASITSAGYYTVDRWRIYIANLGTWTQSQSTDVPSGQGFSYSLKMDCTTADASPAASDELHIGTRFEGQNLQYLKYGTSSAQSLTLSFWVKCNKATTASLQLQDHNNSKMVTKSYTINSANTWEKKTITFNGNTSDTFTNNANLSLGVRWWLDSGSDYTSGTPSGDWEANDNTKRNNNNLGLADSTSNEWYITGVQLEAGTTASDFEFLPRDINLYRCRRYYYDSNADTSQNTIYAFKSIVSQCTTNFFLPVEMRANSTFTFYGDGARAQSNKFNVAGSGGYASTNELYVSSRMGYTNLYSPNNSYNHKIDGGYVADAEL